MNLEEIMPLFDQNPQGLIVKQDNEVIGVVTAQSVVNALAGESDQ
jgi:predicted transcriptional regulator